MEVGAVTIVDIDDRATTVQPTGRSPRATLTPRTRTLYACGVPAVLFEGFAPELPLEVTPDGRWVQTTDEAEVSLRFAATLGVDEEAGDLRFSDALGFDFALEPVAGCTMANGCGERVTPLGVSLDDPWVAIGDDLWAREDGPTAEVVAYTNPIEIHSVKLTLQEEGEGSTRKVPSLSPRWPVPPGAGCVVLLTEPMIFMLSDQTVEYKRHTLGA